MTKTRLGGSKCVVCSVVSVQFETEGELFPNLAQNGAIDGHQLTSCHDIAHKLIYWQKVLGSPIADVRCCGLLTELIGPKKLLGFHPVFDCDAQKGIFSLFLHYD